MMFHLKTKLKSLITRNEYLNELNAYSSWGNRQLVKNACYFRMKIEELFNHCVNISYLFHVLPLTCK